MGFLQTLDHCIEGKGWIFNIQQRITNYSAFRKTFSQYDVSGAKILDIGCGTSGCVHFVWAEKQFKYHGVDLSSSYLRWGKKHYPLANEVCADARLLPFKRMDFNYVCIFSLIHHLPDEVVRQLSQQLTAVSRETRILIADPLFPRSEDATLSDKLSHWLLSHDRGNFIRNADEYVKLFSDKFEVVKKFQFKCCMHHFCGFELKKSDSLKI
jgi:SAM-dependent methyltransferase